MKNIIGGIGLFLLTINQLAAQSYKTAAGIRLGSDIGFTLNQHIKDNYTFELIARTPVTEKQHLGLSGVVKSHQKILTRATNWYFGGGGHYYFKNERDETGWVNPAGLTGILGFETTIGRLNFSFDWKPEWHLSDVEGDNFRSGAGFSIRYVFEKRERRKILERDNFKLPKRDKSKNKSSGNRRKSSRS